MKVYEYLNKLKGTKETLESIMRWSYENRITPCIMDEGLELEREFPDFFQDFIDKHCKEIEDCYKCFDTFFELEIAEEVGHERR